MELVSNLQHWLKNMLEMLVIRYNSIWPNFILIVFRIQRNKLKCSFHIQQCLWWCHRFWNLWISQKQKNPGISITKYLFFKLRKLINYTSGATLLQLWYIYLYLYLSIIYLSIYLSIYVSIYLYIYIKELSSGRTALLSLKIGNYVKK